MNALIKAQKALEQLKGLSLKDAMDVLQDNGVVSDNAVFPSDLDDETAVKAKEFLLVRNWIRCEKCGYIRQATVPACPTVECA